MPEGVVVNVPADKIFVMTGDKPLRAACGDGRALCMIKEYVNIDVEIIYYFEHGIRSIEYMGVCGAGDWAGAYNKEGTFSISTSDRLDEMCIRDRWDTVSTDEYSLLTTRMQAGCLLTIIPPLVVYLIVQRKFTESIERSGIVG